MKVVISGATGFLGTRLVEALSARGDHVVALARSTSSEGAKRLAAWRNVRVLPWKVQPDPRAPWARELDGADAVVNLAGEPVVGKRWSDEQKARIRESRLHATHALVEAIAQATKRPRTLLSASAVGYYGFTGDERLSESAGAGGDFLARVCREWEREAQRAEPFGVRVVRARIGIVLGEEGGALSQMLTPFKLGVGGPIGDGKQWMSWIHVDDVIGMLLFALDKPTLSGPVNVVAPAPVTNRDFSRALGRALHRPSWLPVPKGALKLAFGEVGEVLVKGQRVVPSAAQSAGFHFRHTDLDEALRSILRPTARRAA